MIRRLALTLAVGLTACTPEEDPPSSSTPPLEDPTRQEQGVESLESPSEANALRFLEQATFGPRQALGVTPPPIDTVEHVVAVGIKQAITDQFAAPRSTYDGLATKDLGSQFFFNAIHGQDQLRQRVAFALSQILVVSQNGIPNVQSTPEPEPRIALAGYLNLLSLRAFGNYRQLLEELTLDPAMGTYLDMVNNKAFKANGQPIEPNENYAREMLQLFSLGIYKLNENGTPQLDGLGHKVPVYTEAQVQAFAHTLSGWTYAGATCPTRGRANPPDYTAPMMDCDVNHDASSRELLRGFHTTAGATARQHLTEALDNVFADPNLPPFLCKQLIQHLVTSNPSEAYVQAVVNTFKNNGNGVRGDLRAVVRKILQYDEARGPTAPSGDLARFGHLRSPALYVGAIVRGLDGTLDTSGTLDPGAKLSGWSQSMGQLVPQPPSVFSYYPPNAPAPGGGGLLGPEFAILDTATITARANITHDLLFTGGTANAGVLIDLDLLPTASSDIVQWLNRYWLHGTMSADLQQAVLNAISHPDAGDTLRRKKLAVHLTALSPEFQIQR
ncbi:DUF1800 domain-containing protein [Myxococcus sp. K15C18031901]|uniref:DUF1800 domain-containing protein n=1 Tax=Myxococcus dinghuensis TaxID=2906761 RepID=UPI0020A71911|nr:DUF1800 family protein [Myxococcus dinghuensis]MCP3099507.1 DUF1800 domain-containing protein [Myxococcus dinghuensis]